MKMLKIAETETVPELTHKEKDLIYTHALQPWLKLTKTGENEIVKENIEEFWQTWQAFKNWSYYWVGAAVFHIQQDYYGSGKITEDDIWDIAEEHELKQADQHLSLIQIGKEELAKEESPAQEKALYDNMVWRKKALKALRLEIGYKYVSRATSRIMDSIKKNEEFLTNLYKFLKHEIVVNDISFALDLKKFGGEIYFHENIQDKLHEFVNPSNGGGRIRNAFKFLCGKS